VTTRSLAAVVVALALMVPAGASAARQPAPDVSQLQAQVDALTIRVAALEAAVWSAPTPTPAPSASPTPQPTPSAPAASSGLPPTPTPAIPMGSRPASGPLAFSGNNCPAVIENRTFRDLGANVIAIRIENCANVTIRDVDFINVSEGVYAIDSANIRVERTRYQNITGPHERVGLNRANLVQFNRVSGGYIGHNKGRCGDTEDIVSIYASSNVVAEYNHFEGVYVSSPGCLAWSSGSGTAIITGDGTGTGNIIRNNIAVNPGQVGLAIAGGSGHRIADNIVIGQQHPGSNVGIYASNYSSGACTGNTVTGNRVLWRNAAGTSNGWYSGSCTGTATSGNNWNDTSLDIEAFRVTFP